MAGRLFLKKYNFVMLQRVEQNFLSSVRKQNFHGAGSFRISGYSITQHSSYHQGFLNADHSSRRKQRSILHVCSASLNFQSYLSTSGNEENYKVVISNPAENTTTVSELSSFKTSLPASNTPSLTDEAILTPPDIATPILDNVQSAVEAVEPTLASLGLANNWTPVGWIEQLLEYMHIQGAMPWWMAIVTCTVIARILMIPLLIKNQKNSISMSNHMPQLQFLQAKFGEARRMGNNMEASRYASEIMAFMKQHNISPLKNAMLPMLQAPVFISFFLGLRAMAKLPVESMKYGGLSWTQDLTIPDPYYILPAVACGTLYVVLKVGAESGVRMENLKMMKYVLQALPVIVFPFCMNFPAAVLYYWCTTNFCTLAIVSVMQIKSVKDYLKIPTQQAPDSRFVMEKKGFVKSIKESYEDQKVLQTVEDRRRIDEIRFQKAGTGPIPRTYAYDPTKPRPAQAAAASQNVQAKQKS